MTDMPQFPAPAPPLAAGKEGAPDPAAAGPTPPESHLLTLLEDLADEVEVPTVRWKVETRQKPGREWAVEYRTDVSETDFNRFTELSSYQRQPAPVNRAQRRHRRNQADGETAIKQAEFASMLLATYCVALYRADQLVINPQTGEPMTFRDRLFQEEVLRKVLDPVTQEPTAARAVRQIYGVDGHVISHGRFLMQESGWLSDNPEDADPTSEPTPGW